MKRETPMPARYTGIDGLSQRQKEILRLIGQNMQAKEVARKLQISETTVRTQLDRARQRLGVSTSRDAARRLISFERDEGVINHDGHPPVRIVESASESSQRGHEQDFRPERTIFHGPLDGFGSRLEDARIAPKEVHDTGYLRNHADAQSGVHSGRSGFQYGSRNRLADRRWALFERRLTTLKLWQWFGIAFLAAVCMTVVGGALIQGAVVMFRAIHEIQR